MGRNRPGRNPRAFNDDGGNGNNSSGGGRFMGMSMDKPYYEQNQSYRSSLSNNNYGQMDDYNNSGSSSNKTPEQLAFDDEFAKWESSFDGWRREFSNRSDTDEFKQYERKFLDVRDKLLEKRKQIYRQNSFASEFENQLSAADAMAKSILSKFDEPARNESRNSNRNFNNNPSGSSMNQPRNYNMNNQPRNNNMNNPDLMAILQLAQGLGCFNNNPGGGGGMRNNPQSQSNGIWASGPYMNMSNNRGFRNMSGYNRQPPSARGYERRDINRRNNDRDPIGSNRNAAQSRTPRKSVNDRLEKKKTEPVVQLSIAEKMKIIREAAEKVECPRLMSGACNRKLRAARDKKSKDEELTEDEKGLIELHEFLSAKRRVYYDAKNAEKDRLRAEAEAAAAAEKKDDTIVSEEKMDESAQVEVEKAIDSMEVETTEQLDEDALLA